MLENEKVNLRPQEPVTPPKPCIVISSEEYETLLRRSDMLAGLQAGGVDNWEWYSESLREFYKKYYPEEQEDDAEALN
jgi:hypothetical protein